MKQELQYLRDELNKRMSIQIEHTSKTINTVLLIWGGILILLGKDWVKFTATNPENIFLYFIMATILFVSSLVLFYTARKYYVDTDNIFKIGAYIAVFYEKRPSKTVKVGDNFFWELAIFETTARYIANNTGRKKGIFRRNIEYFVLTFISTGLMLLLLTAFFLKIPKESGMGQTVSIILFLICVTYLGVSIYLLCEIPKYTFLKDDYSMRIRHLQDFMEYALYTKHYTKKELRDRFGAILNYIDVRVPVTWKKAKKNN